MTFEVKNYISKKNYTLLKKNHPGVLKEIKDSGAEPCGEVVFAPNTKPNLKIDCNGQAVFLHPQHDPQADKDYFLPKILEDFSGVEIIFGMGFAYGVQEVLRQRKSIRYLVVIENDPGIFIQALKYMDLSDLLSDPKVIISLSPESAESFMGPVKKAISFEDTQILEHPVFFSVFQEAYDHLRTMVFNYVNTHNISGATKIKFGKKIVRNRFAHLKSMGHHYLFENIIDKFQGIPAYIAAAGPSLDKNIQLLKKVKNKAVILSVDTALPAFLDNGIFPDFVSSIDYKEDTYEKFSNKINDIPDETGLLVYSWTAPRVVKNFPGNRKFYLMTEVGIDRWMNTLVNGKRFFAGGSSVATLNFIAANVLGCSPVIFVGQDLSYGSKQTHSKSAILTVNDLVKESLETGKDLVWVKGVQGGEVPTTRGMKNTLNVFEEMIKNNPGEYINCSTDGAHIEGTRYIPLEDAVNKYSSDNHNVSRVLNDVCSEQNTIDANMIVKKLNQDLEIVSKMFSLIGKTENYLKKGLGELPKIRKNWKKNPVLSKKTGKLLKDIDKVNMQIDNYENIWNVLEEVTAEGLKKNEQMVFEIQKLEGITRKYPEWLEKTIRRLLYINTVRKQSLDLLKTGVADVVQHIKKEQDLLKSGTDNTKTVSDFAELYISSRDYVLARPFVEQYIAIEPKSARANYFMGCLEARANSFEKMNSFFLTAVSIDPNFDQQINEFQQNLGDVYLESADHFSKLDSLVAKRLLLKGLRFCLFHEEIQKMLKQLIIQDTKKIIEADIKSALDGEKERIKSWTRTIEEFPQATAFLTKECLNPILYFMGKMEYLSGDKDNAINYFNKSIETAPEDADLVIKIADLLLCAFDYDHGLVFLNKAIELDPKHKTFWEKFGDYLLKLGRFDESLTAYEQAVHYFPEKMNLFGKRAECLLQKGNQFHQSGDYENADIVYDEAINCCPDNASCLVHLYNNKGSALKNIGKYEDAMTCYDKTLDINPGYAEALYNKGELLQTLGKLDGALELYEAAIKSSPDFVIAYNKIGNLLVSRGENSKAEQMFNKARQISSQMS